MADDESSPQGSSDDGESSTTVKFKVSTLSGQTFDISIQKDATITSLKRKIERADDAFPVKAQKFMLKGIPLSNEKGTVDENSITEGCTLYLVKRLRTNSAELLDPPPKKGSSASNASNLAGHQIIRVVCPPNASAGSRVRISLSDGRQLMVQVPAGVGPGMPFQVAIRNTQSARNSTRSPIRPPVRRNGGASHLVRVICPPNAGPGSVVAINISGRGTIHVRVPNGVYPGQPFNVRV